MELILIRHAIAFERDLLRWPDDSARPLTPEGVSRFERAALGLRSICESVDIVLSSPYVRAMETAQILEEQAGWPEPIHCAVLEPSHESVDVIAFLQEQQHDGVVALVGHEPLLGELAGVLLAGESAPAQPFKKGGAASFRSDRGVGAGAMTLRWWLPPKFLRRLGST